MLPSKIAKIERPFPHFRANWSPIRMTPWAQAFGVFYLAKFSIVPCNQHKRPCNNNDFNTVDLDYMYTGIVWPSNNKSIN